MASKVLLSFPLDVAGDNLFIKESDCKKVQFVVNKTGIDRLSLSEIIQVFSNFSVAGRMSKNGFDRVSYLLIHIYIASLKFSFLYTIRLYGK